MDVDPDKEESFNEVYDTEHTPYLLDVLQYSHLSDSTRAGSRARISGHG